MVRLCSGMVVLALTLLGTAYLKGDSIETKPRGTLPAGMGKVGLRDDQRKEIYKIQASFRAKSDELKRQLAKLKDEERAAVESVLTADQMKRLREIRTGERPKEGKEKVKDGDKGKEADKEKKEKGK